MISQLLLLALASGRWAFDTSHLPSCGAKCVDTNINTSSCAATDTSCLCGDQNLAVALGFCIGTACDEADLLATEQGIESVCGTANVPAATGATGNILSQLSISGLGFLTATVATGSATGTAFAGSSTGSTNSGSSKGPSGLSEGAKIGIACAVPLTVLAILVAYLIGRARSKRGAANTAGASAAIGNAYEHRSDIPPQQQQMQMAQQQGMVMGGMAPMPMDQKAAGVSELDVKSGAAGGMVPVYATPPSSVGSPPPMMPGYAAPPQGVMMMQPAPPGVQQQVQELPGGSYMVYPQGPVYEVPAGGQTPAVAQAVPQEMPQQHTVYEAPGS